MKKILLMIIIFLVILSNTSISSKEDYPPGIYYVEVDNLTTENIDEIINDEIIAVEPYINPIYKKCVLIDYDTLDKTRESINIYYDLENIKKSNKIKRIIIYSKNNLDKKYSKPQLAKNYSCKID